MTRSGAPTSPTSCCSPPSACNATHKRVADGIGDTGAAGLKRVVTEAVNERLGPVRARRSALIQDRGYLREVLRDGTGAAKAMASRTLAEVQRLMHTAY